MSKRIIEFMGSGYIGISFVGLLAECNEDVARHIDARRVNNQSQRRAKKAFGNFSGKLVLGGGGHT